MERNSFISELFLLSEIGITIAFLAFTRFIALIESGNFLPSTNNIFLYPFASLATFLAVSYLSAPDSLVPLS